MTPEERDRLTRLEEGAKERGEDIKEIKDLLVGLTARMNSLEAIAARGSGGLKMALFVGGVLGWVMSFVLGLVAIFKH